MNYIKSGINVTEVCKITISHLLQSFHSFLIFGIMNIIVSLYDFHLGSWQLGGMGHYHGTWWKYMLHSQQVIDNVLNILNFWMNRSCSSNCSNIIVYVLHGKEKRSPKLTSLKTLIDLFRHVSYNFTVSVWSVIAYDKVSW